MNDALYYVMDVLLSLAALLFLMRFLVQAVRADFYNPISQSIVKITDPVLKPLRVVIPSYQNLDFAAFIAAMVAKCLFLYGTSMVSGQDIGNIVQLIGVGLLQTLLLVLRIFYWSILIGIIASFIAPQNDHPLLLLIYQITEPLLAPARKLLPAMGGLDFSPIIVFLILGVIERILPSLFSTLLF
ncbi:MAG: YggT family protein [Pseudomonadales bacterium]